MLKKIRWLLTRAWGLGLFFALAACTAPATKIPTRSLAPTRSLSVATFTPTPLPAIQPASPENVAPADAVPADAAANVPVDTTVDAPAAATLAPATVVPLTIYTVQPNDTLFGLAVDFSVPIAALQLQNNLGNSTLLHVGDELVIPPSVGWEGASPFWVVHEVAEGEVLTTIAADYGLDVTTLQGVNGLADADLLSIGQALILPLDAPAEVVAEAHLPTPAPLPVATSTPARLEPEVAAVVAATGVTPTIGEAATLIATPEPTVVPLPVSPAGPVDPAALPSEVFRLINEQRAAYGLAPLTWNATLAYAAQSHADDCYARGWCGHGGSDGSTMKERIIRAGYSPVRWSECWAWYGSAEAAVAAWMDEVPPNDPHRRTLLSTWLTEVGVGVVPGNGFGYYFIADFGTQ
ncbi:MAG: LysM peptidoglycan-binding domain-containing protein [Anaerolineae bacterium]|nr:LysM peptidoglycan-binding domain-containing protein [Anaerolineae bacterium]